MFLGKGEHSRFTKHGLMNYLTNLSLPVSFLKQEASPVEGSRNNMTAEVAH